MSDSKPECDICGKNTHRGTRGLCDSCDSKLRVAHMLFEECRDIVEYADSERDDVEVRYL